MVPVEKIRGPTMAPVRCSSAAAKIELAYAVMARETGALIAAALKASGASPRDEAFRSALLETSVDGPRGPVAFDPETQEIAPAQHMLEIRRDGERTIVDRAETPAPPELLEEQVALARKNMQKSEISTRRDCRIDDPGEDEVVRSPSHQGVGTVGGLDARRERRRSVCDGR